MKNEVKIILAEDDDGHAALIKKNLRRAGVMNKIIHFRDGEETLDFLMKKGSGPHREDNEPYLMLLDIRMPKMDGVEVLRKVKKDEELKKMPTIMITTTDDPREISKCHEIGCSNYITKPVDYDQFVDSIRQLGFFLMVVEVPRLNGAAS